MSEILNNCELRRNEPYEIIIAANFKVLILSCRIDERGMPMILADSEIGMKMLLEISIELYM
jgi:hypothetical protein